MPEPKAELIRAVYQRWAQGDLRAGVELFSRNIVVQTAAVNVETAVGVEGVREHMREFLAQWSDFRAEAVEIAESGDVVLVTERQRGTGKASGVEVEMTSYAIWTFLGDEVSEIRWETDRARALEAAGMSG